MSTETLSLGGQSQLLDLLLDSYYNIKVSNFGFATRLTGRSLETYCGSYAYAAPEIILGHPYDGEKADTWSMGVTLFTMVVVQLPFKDTDVKILLADIGSSVVFPSRISDECKSLIHSILTFNCLDRATLDTIQQHPWMTKTFEDEPDPSTKPPKLSLFLNGALSHTYSLVAPTFLLHTAPTHCSSDSDLGSLNVRT